MLFKFTYLLAFLSYSYIIEYVLVNIHIIMYWEYTDVAAYSKGSIISTEEYLCIIKYSKNA